MANNIKVKTIAELKGFDISKLRRRTTKILNDCGIKNRPDDTLSDLNWVKTFELMCAGNYKKWKIVYQTALNDIIKKSNSEIRH
jgi:hypothetical protein